MRLPIRNVCVARGPLPTGANSAVYTVPVGYVLLLKAVHMRKVDGTDWHYQVNIVSTTPFAVVTAGDVHTTGVDLAWEGWIALNETDQIVLTNLGGALEYWVSGALLPWAPVPPLAAVSMQTPPPVPSDVVVPHFPH